MIPLLPLICKIGVRTDCSSKISKFTACDLNVIAYGLIMFGPYVVKSIDGIVRPIYIDSLFIRVTFIIKEFPKITIFYRDMLVIIKYPCREAPKSTYVQKEYYEKLKVSTLFHFGKKYE